MRLVQFYKEFVPTMRLRMLFESILNPISVIGAQLHEIEPVQARIVGLVRNVKHIVPNLSGVALLIEQIERIYLAQFGIS